MSSDRTPCPSCGKPTDECCVGDGCTPSAATASPIEKMLDDAYDRGGWPEARRWAVSLHAAAKSGVQTTLAALDTLVASGIPYEDARRLVDDARKEGEAMTDGPA